MTKDWLTLKVAVVIIVLWYVGMRQLPPEVRLGWAPVLLIGITVVVFGFRALYLRLSRSTHTTGGQMAISPFRLLAICMVLAPFLAFLGSLIGFHGAGGVEPALMHRDRELVHSERHLVAHALWLISSFLFIPAGLGLLALVPDRLYSRGVVGVALLLLGSFGHGLVISYSMVSFPLLQSDLDQEAVTMFILTDMYAHPAFSIVATLYLVFYLGFLLLVYILACV